ncbi:hypothetical protein EDB84DRAFT_1518741 [Lactarius hengduanensis]|nr:hypothetical protein EDB84DRAFT_1518741 [Lactarius hengduanensis]
MAHHRAPYQQADHLPANAFPLPPLHQAHGHVQPRVVNPHIAGDDQQDINRQEGVPQPLGNVVEQDEMQYPRHIGAPNYNPAHYYPPPPPYPEDPYVRIHRDVGVAQGFLAEAHDLPPAVQENHDGRFGYGAQFPAADPPGAFHNVWPDPAPPAHMLPVNGLRNLLGRYLNNPDTLINVVWIEPGPGGRFKVWIALEMADIT